MSEKSEIKPEDVEVLRKLREVVELYKVLVKENKELENIFITLLRCLYDVEKLLKMERVEIVIGQGDVRFGVVCGTQITLRYITNLEENKVIDYIRKRFIEEKWPRVLELIVMWLREIIENVRNKLYMVETKEGIRP
jgi:hypothetical protein